MLLGPVLCGKAQQGFRTRQCLIEHLGLPSKEMIALGFAHQRGTGDRVGYFFQGPGLRRLDLVTARAFSLNWKL
jgi:hypothetical protein